MSWILHTFASAEVYVSEVLDYLSTMMFNMQGLQVNALVCEDCVRVLQKRLLNSDEVPRV